LKIFLAVIKFLFIGALFIISNNHLYIGTSVDFSIFRGMYFDWLNSLFDYGRDITAYVIDSQWLPSSV